MPEKRKKFISKVVFHKNRKTKDYYDGVLVNRDDNFISFDFKKADDRIRYIKNYIEMDGDLCPIPENYKIIHSKNLITYLFYEVKNNSCFSFNDWADLSFFYSDTPQDKDNGNNEFMRNLNKNLNKEEDEDDEDDEEEEEEEEDEKKKERSEFWKNISGEIKNTKNINILFSKMRKMEKEIKRLKQFNPKPTINPNPIINKDGAYVYKIQVPLYQPFLAELNQKNL